MDNLTIGSKGDAVKQLQTKLGITADGIYGSQTQAAVKSYQQSNGLTVDGVAGAQTLGKLNTSLAPGANTGIKSPTLGNIPPLPTSPIDTKQMTTATSAPDATSFITPTTTPSFSDTVTKVASANLNSAGAAADTLLAQQQKQQEAAKAAATTTVAADKTAIQANVGSTAEQDALAKVNTEFKVKENIQALSDIQTKIISAQEALNQGLIYEEGRPARQQFVTGATALLQKQGLATIGALQATATVIQGNITLAKSYADTVIGAIKDDNDRSLTALNTLLNLDNNQLITLTADEKSTVNARIKQIQDQSTELQKNADDVFTLISANPQAAAAGGVTLTDTREQAIAKMVPTMSKLAQIKFNADIAKTNAEAAASRRSGGTKTGVSAADTLAAKNLLLEDKNDNMTYDQAINTYSAVLTPEYISSVYGVTAAGKNVTSSDLYGAFINPDGSPKPGYSVTLNDKGQPIIAKDAASDSGNGGLLSKVGNWIGDIYKSL